MAKTTNKTAVAKASSSTGLTTPLDKAGVTTLIEQLKAKLQSLKAGSPEAVSLDISYNGTNIKNVTKVSELMEISASINARSAAYQIEVERYDLTGKVKPFTVSDKTVEEWIEIIKKAVYELVNKKEIQQTENAIKELSQFEDEQTKFARKINEIVGGATELLS